MRHADHDPAHFIDVPLLRRQELEARTGELPESGGSPVQTTGRLQAWALQSQAPEPPHRLKTPREIAVTRHPSTVSACVLLVLSILLMPPSPASGQEPSRRTGAAQAIRGNLIDLEAMRPILAGAVTLLSGDERLGTATTDDEGFFFLPVPESGQYQLEARRLGYATTVSQPFEVTRGDTVTVRFAVSPEAILLEPLVVVAHTSRGMYRFLDHMEEWGKGIFLTPAMIDSLAPWHYADVFRGQEDIWLSWGWGELSTGSRGLVPRIHTFRGDGCMSYMVNRTRIGSRNWYLLDELDPKWIVAVEIYRYVGELPPDMRNEGNTEESWIDYGAFGGAEYRRNQLRSCGVTVYWTFQGW